ncbi:putative nucleoporin interacting component (NUP93) [Leishmania infantum JPCM5]|uniref:Nuclear pore protein n=3 Tax=Leishmania donovani species complex TaxID=38574 RepID=A4ICF7_LEIIN|nr:putative nucleoporin interacting component (NUP93) [Leishmania infantum JPCM5]XP_003865379.1 nucleoporin interacting component (NUP93), putative [Leishmania donovani]CAC9550471.1 nucleoporin_interacting_component_(NUP93)_-_putative [Leishmania infantum]AYU83614.1 nucleoporin interacting component (NUP93), putative [Leishmania donovani]TPP48372.1 Nup93/Nic96 family protein [Leishmania donovani]CAM72535.1 putative nucleoporin interacting component (NUP93) [Leishmania infantum JPCM5]CBZ38702.|eukprot:XP_001469426.1 putative nucleoporin interacting component (NUP93) [Leishmania infantum JPCM5]
MFSSTSNIAPRRLGSAGPGGDDASALRVMPSAGDPADEVRVSLASLTARAQRLVSERDAEQLLRNGFGLFEASRKAAEEARHQANKCQSTSEGYAPATHASVELFMTQHLGFDAQAQQRLLRQLQRRHAQLGVDLGPIDTLPGAEASGFTGIADVDAVVAELKNDILLDVQHAVHRRQTSIVRDQVDTLFKAAWHPFYVRVADDYETLSMGANELAAGKAGASGRLRSMGTAAPSANALGGVGSDASSSLVDILNSGSSLAMELSRRVAAFAAIVEEYAPAQWITHFTAYVTETSLDGANDLTVLWASIVQIIEPMQRRGSEADILSYVASSRRVMERKSLSRLLERVLRMDPMRFEEVENMSASHLMDVIARSCGVTNHWMHTFVAMRVGRYDVAQLAMDAIGIQSVRDAMAKMAATPPAERNAMPPASDLQPVYAEAKTKEDPYRQAVLMVLLAGRTGESPAAVLRTILSLAQRVTDSLEDALWLRLSCIRGVDKSAQVTPVQSLRTLQRAVLDDMQDLVSITQGNACRLASFLIHALLPSTGLRLLLENNITHVDGFHMALCFSAQNLLQGRLHSALEAPIDIARHMSRYCSVVLLGVDRRLPATVFAGTAIFAYFHKSGLTEAFVECCLKDVICARLLGSRNAVGGQDALLLRAGAGALSEELLKALMQVAEAASARSEVAKATHVLLAVAFLASQLCRPELQQRALRRAVQMMSPALAQVLHLPSRSSVVSDVLSQAAQLQQAVNAVPHHLNEEAINAQDYQTFALLCRMADVYAFNVSGNFSDAVDAFLQLPFVPPPNTAVTGGVDAYVEAYCNAPGSVQLGASAALRIAISAAGKLLQYYARSSTGGGADVDEKRLRLLHRMQTVLEWARQCCALTSVAYPAVAEEFERVYMC